MYRVEFLTISGTAEKYFDKNILVLFISLHDYALAYSVHKAEMIHICSNCKDCKYLIDWLYVSYKSSENIHFYTVAAGNLL